ncbi:MAG TPA: molecular chaperone DnaJ [Actinomycetota bacterium]|jgi:molecular chaperone DnaJ|nr:molecular chaperone DnaJ [Actinomycetota bacterium]
MATDLYEILGVGRNASQEEIRRAYRRLARELHPDVSGDPGSEERFKEVSAAYEILSDPQKRQQYDLYGQGGGPDMFPFTDVADIFEAFFGTGTFGRRRPQRRSRSQRGEDAGVRVSLTFEEAAFGTERRIDIETLRVCERCGGNGAEPGTSPERCHTCGGAGQVQDVRRSIFGTVMSARPCPTCQGTGEEVASPCTECRSEGRVMRARTVTVEIPAGVSDGVELRVPGEGHAGRAGGSPGDLYVTIGVEPSPLFDRRDQDLFALLDISMEQAALGAELEIPTLDGAERVKLEPGTDSGSVIRLRGKGIPNLGRRGRGDLYLTVHVETPRDLGKRERALIQELAELRGEAAGKGASAEARLRRPR